MTQGVTGKGPESKRWDAYFPHRCPGAGCAICRWSSEHYFCADFQRISIENCGTMEPRTEDVCTASIRVTQEVSTPMSSSALHPIRKASGAA